MIWNGTDPLQPDHEVSYRGWPTERVRIREINRGLSYPVVVEHSGGLFSAHRAAGEYYDDGFESARDLIPLQQEPTK